MNIFGTVTLLPSISRAMSFWQNSRADSWSALSIFPAMYNLSKGHDCKQGRICRFIILTVSCASVLVRWTNLRRTLASQFNARWILGTTCGWMNFFLESSSSKQCSFENGCFWLPYWGYQVNKPKQKSKSTYSYIWLTSKDSMFDIAQRMKWFSIRYPLILPEPIQFKHFLFPSDRKCQRVHGMLIVNVCRGKFIINHLLAQARLELKVQH